MDTQVRAECRNHTNDSLLTAGQLRGMSGDSGVTFSGVMTRRRPVQECPASAAVMPMRRRSAVRNPSKFYDQKSLTFQCVPERR